MPDDLERAVRRWSLSGVEPIADTATSRVYRVQRPGGELAALKILKPYGADEIVGVSLQFVWIR